jgi:putative serine protease PepD
MTQSTEGRDGDSRYAWAATSTQQMPGQGATRNGAPYAGAANATAQANQAAPPSYSPTYPPTGQGAYPYAGPAGGYTTPPAADRPGGTGFPPAPPGGPGARGPRRGPGWGGVAAVGLSAAVLSSLLTAGLVSLTRDDAADTAATDTTSQTTQTAPGPVTSSNAKNPDWEAVANAVEPSVVAVKVSSQGGSGEGSGVILDKNGQILTNNHVVAGASSVEVDLADGRGYDAKVVGTDPSTDLAVIKIQDPPADLKPATLGSSSAVKVGDPVMAVGNPLGLAGTVTTGIISAVDRPVTTQAESSDPLSQDQSETVITNAIQTDAAVNPGNSGGALVDVQGRVVGINSSIASLGSSLGGSQSGSIGLGFAIPIDEAKYVAGQLSDGGSVAHAWLGVVPADGEVTVRGAQRSAAVLQRVESGSPAAKAGLKTGDAVISVDGDAVNSATSLVGQIHERRPNQAVTLQIVRDGKAQTLKATLGTSPQN